ncbi:hypothetical protein KC939_01555 [Candidatus Saccharibacteria bacterium]|nr:hypothetical protein [Candidatus Saccharibacteria bacterium]
MIRHEKGSTKIDVLSEDQHQYDHLAENINHIKYLLALSGGWVNRKTDGSLTPFRQTMSYKWNVPFYSGFYPDLDESDVPGYRIAAKLDGKAIVHLSDISRQLQPGNDQRYLDIDLDYLQPLVDGTSINNAPLSVDKDLGRKSPTATKRIEGGMPRGMRIFSAMIPLDHLNRSDAADDMDMGAHQDKLFDILDLSTDERELALSLLSQVHDLRKLRTD